MRQFILAAALIATPVAAFSIVETVVVPPKAATSSVGGTLGDLSPLRSIIEDTRALVAAGDLAAAEKRITDFETLWDRSEATLRPKATAAWGAVDGAADAALDALRASIPTGPEAEATLQALSAVLADPAKGGVQTVSGVEVTDQNGHPLPCEAMLRDLQSALATGAIPPANQP